MPKQCKKCSICESAEGQMTAQVFCDYDLQMKRMIVKDIKVFTEMHLIKSYPNKQEIHSDFP